MASYSLTFGSGNNLHRVTVTDSQTNEDTLASASHLFALLHFILQGLFGDLHLYQLLPKLLILLLCLCPLLLHIFQLMVQAHRHILCHLGEESRQNKEKKQEEGGSIIVLIINLDDDDEDYDDDDETSKDSLSGLAPDF